MVAADTTRAGETGSAVGWTAAFGVAALLLAGGWAAAAAGTLPGYLPVAVLGLGLLLFAAGRVSAELGRLRTIETSLRAAADALPDGLAVYDAGDRLIFFNARYPEHLMPAMRAALKVGIQFGDFLRAGLANGPVYHPEMGEDFGARRMAIRNQGGKSDHLQRLADGRWLRIRESRTPNGGCVLLTQDVTEEQARADELRLLAAAIEQVAQPVEITNAEHSFIYVNHAFETTTGYDRAAVLGQLPQDVLTSGVHPPAFFEDLRETLERGETWTGTIINRHRDGHLIEQATTISPMRNASGKITHFVAVKRDVTEAQAHARALAESEARYRAVVDAQTEYILRVDAAGRWTFMNEAAERYFGLSFDKVKALGFLDRDFVHPDDRALFDAHLARITPAHPTDMVEFRGILPDGRVHWEQWTDTGLFDSAGRLVEIQCVGREITDRKRAEAARDSAEKALADSEARFRTIAENVPVGVMISDIGSGRPLFINASARAQLGLGPSQMPETILDTWTDRGDRERLLAEVAREGSVSGFEAEILLDNDRRITALFSATRIFYGGTPALLTATVDITDLRRTQAELEASEARLSAIIAANPVALNIARVGDRRLLFANQPYIELYGLEGEDLDSFDRDTLYDDPVQRDWIYEEIAAGREVTNHELKLRRRDGTHVITSLTSRHILFQGEPALVTSSVDLTALRAAQAEAARSREALHQSEKLTALGALLAGVAHELNNPLSVVVGYSSMLKDLTTDPAMLGRVEKIHAAAERCARIIRTFLAMARARPPKRGPVVLADVVMGGLDLAAYGLRSADVQVAVDVSGALPPVHGDADQLHQVVVNLVVNAQHALLGRAAPRRLTLRAWRDGDMALLEVADNGPGMAPEVATRAFEPFFTTKPQGVGTGVGLSVCHGIVEAHGGTIALVTAPGEGARFRVRLPFDTSDAAVPGDAAPAPVGTGRVLVVDDEPEIAALLADRLRAEGLGVATASSGRRALAALEAGGIDAVVSDLRMPDMDGAALAQEIARRWPELARRLILITGDALGADPGGRLATGEVPVFEKPLDLGALADELRRRLALGRVLP